MNRERRNREKGFTLVELIVVLVILAILAAIMVPALLGWIDKAKEKKCLLEARNVVLAAQGIATEEYAAGVFDGNPVVFIQKNQQEIFKLADITSDKAAIKEITFQTQSDGKPIAVIKTLRYKTSDGKIVLYDVNGNPVYQISEETGAPGYMPGWQDVILNMAPNDRRTPLMQQEILAANGGAFPDLTDSEKARFPTNSSMINSNQLKDKIDQLTWKPVEAKSASEGFLMIANPMKSSGSNINADMIYYQGAYYVCIEKLSGNDNYKISSESVQNNFDVSKLTNAGSLSEYEGNPPTMEGKVWVRV